MSAIILIAQAATLPRMPALGSARLGTLVEVLRRPGVAVGMVCAMLVFIGHFAFFTYLRPFLEFTTGAGIAMISSVLLGFGVANLFGTLLAGFMLERSLRATLASMPLVMAVVCACLATFNSSLWVDLALITLWGMAFGRARRLVDMAHPHYSRRSGKRRWPARRGGASRHYDRGGRRGRDLRFQGRDRRLRSQHCGSVRRRIDGPFRCSNAGR